LTRRCRQQRIPTGGVSPRPGQVAGAEIVQRPATELRIERQRGLDLRPILAASGLRSDAAQYCTEARNKPRDPGTLAARLLDHLRDAIANATGGEFAYDIRNSDRSIGARLSGEIARAHGNLGMSDAPITARFSGFAGQSFGAWNAGGLNLHLTGDANDYVGKGMPGGRIVLQPPAAAGYTPGDDIAIALDPATSELEADGQYTLAREGRTLPREEMVDLWADWVRRYPVVSIEDGMAQEDWDGWRSLTARIGDRVQLVGDDIFVTNVERIREGIRQEAANSVLMKVNQVGTLSETPDAIAEAPRAGPGPGWGARWVRPPGAWPPTPRPGRSRYGSVCP